MWALMEEEFFIIATHPNVSPLTLYFLEILGSIVCKLALNDSELLVLGDAKSIWRSPFEM